MEFCQPFEFFPWKEETFDQKLRIEGVKNNLIESQIEQNKTKNPKQ